MKSLFEPYQEALDQRYKLVRDDSRFKKQKDFVESLWQKFSPFADPDFQKEISHQFHPRFWEMYLGYTLIETGYELLPRTASRGPDIKVNYNGRTLWIEATAPDAGRGDDAVPGFGTSNEVIRVPEEQLILRLTNSIYKKYQTFQNYLSNGVVKDSDIFVLAINEFDIPHAILDSEVPFIVKSVLPFGDLAIDFDLNEMKSVKEYYKYREHIEKKSGSTVSTKAFQNLDFSFIAGILYSISDLWNLPVGLGDDFLFVHNPTATIPLEKGWLRRGKHCWVEENRLRFGNSSLDT